MIQKKKIWKMNFNISTSTTAGIANQTRDLKLYEYDGEYSDYYSDSEDWNNNAGKILGLM